MTDTVYLAAVNITSRLVILTDDRVFPITNFFDWQGDECEPDEATCAVAGESGLWFTFDPREWDGSVSVH